MHNRDYEYAEAIRAIQLPPEASITSGRGLAILAVIILVLLGIAGAFDYASALEMEADEKVARAERAANLTFPLLYEISVTQSLPSGREQETRFYQRTSTRNTESK